jgi:hypothetical protein
MFKFKVTCSQKLDDGDTALVEEYNSNSLTDINDIIGQYAERATSKSYVDSFTVKVEIIK